MDEEEWFGSISSVVNALKLRGSYGSNGNESGFGFYEPLTTYGYGFNYNGQTGSAPNNVGDPGLTWELNKPLNIGIDLGLFADRISLSADYYNRTTSNLILGANTSRATGWASYTTNIGEMTNKGVEIALKAVPLKLKAFEWTVNVNYANNQNRITALYQNKDQVSGSFVRSVGYDYQTFYTRLWAGVDPANGDPLWYTDETKKTTTNNANLAKQVKFGTASPKFFGGFGNTFSYKGFVLDAQFTFSGGYYQRDNLGSLYFSDGASAARNKVKAQLDRWQKPGDITNVPKYIINGNKSSNAFSTRYLYRADNMRLRNLQLGYTFADGLAKKLRMQNLNFYVRGTNLFTLVKDKNLPWDPEQGISEEFAADVYIPKTISVGLNLGF